MMDQGGRARPAVLFAMMLAAGSAGTLPKTASAAEADVVAVKVARAAADVYDFAVTVRSRDSGWERYADRLEAVGPDGKVLGTRLLEHPHDDEQPFTRDLDGVRVTGATKVTIRVHFKPTGYGGTTRTVDLPGETR